MNKPVKPQHDHAFEVQAQERPVCGIVMPISAMGDYDEAHWLRVRIILDRAIEAAGFKPRMVSESEEIAVIQESIVQNLYDNEIVVVDVSGKNPNVMFELGLRLAFDKPTIIIKDDETSYNFDTSPIKHINYRRDLRFDDVERLQRDVTAVIKATLAKKEEDKDYSPFLKTFGKIRVATLETTEVNSSEFIMAQLQGIQKQISTLSRRIAITANEPLTSGYTLESDLEKLAAQILLNNDVKSASGLERARAHLGNELSRRGVTITSDGLSQLIKHAMENVLSGLEGK